MNNNVNNQNKFIYFNRTRASIFYMCKKFTSFVSLRLGFVSTNYNCYKKKFEKQTKLFYRVTECN